MKRRFKLHSGQWARVRRTALERDNYRCVKCGRGGRLEVDHIRPLHLGGAWYDLGNLQSLCYDCHSAKSLREKKARPDRPGYREKWAALMDIDH